MRNRNTDTRAFRIAFTGLRLAALGLATAGLAQAEQPDHAARRATPAQRRALENLPAGVNVVAGEDDVPAYVMGRLGGGRDDRRDPVKAAARALEAHGDAFRRRAEDGFELRGREDDEEHGQTHVRMGQTHRGVPVVGGELIVHLDDEGVAGISGRFVPEIDVPSIESSFTETQAAELARGRVERDGGGNSRILEVGKPVILADGSTSEPRLAVPVDVLYAHEGTPYLDRLYVDARDGNVLARHPRSYTAKVRRIYDAQQACSETALPGRFLFQEGGSSYDIDAMNAYNGTGKTYDFYKTVFGRDSYDGAGSPLVSSQHFTFGDGYYCSGANAAWFEAPYNQMVYGDGDSFYFSNLAGEVDITAHEVTHGVTAATAKLVYARESGALNEATSDILGESTAFFAGEGDWKLGGRVYTPYISGDAMRYMYDPFLDGSSPDYYPNRLYASGCTPAPENDMCGVHHNSGIANLFYYLLCQGGQHPWLRTTVQVPAIGIAKGERIWYRALTTYMTSTTNFAGARTATAQAAADLYGGACSATWQSVQKAWDAVGVPGTWSCTGGGTTTGQKLLNPGFESGNVSWTTTAGVIDSSTKRPARTGAWKAWLNGYGQTVTDTMYQQVAIPTTATSASLSFYLRIDTAETATTARDTLKVQIRNTSNAVLATLATYSNLNSSTAYTQKSFNVTAYKGQTIRVYFLGTENATLQTSFIVDDTALNVQ